MDVTNTTEVFNPTWANNYLYAYENFTNIFNIVATMSPELADLRTAQKALYPPIVFIMILCCFIAVTYNVLILVSVCWIRRPLSPTLQFSLSLAGADVYTSVLIATNLAVNSLPVVFSRKTPMDDISNRWASCYLLLLECLRLGGIYTTLAHLLALAFNHYLGIMKPLQYPSILTNRNIVIISILLWVVPPGGLVVYCSLLDDDGFSSKDEGCGSRFIMKADFRRAVSLVFFVSAGLIFMIYLHIFFLVKRHQANRNRFRRVGSTYSRTNAQTENQQAQSSNVKAYRTTVLIVGSVMLGFFPASTYFMLVCMNECLITPPRSPWVLIMTNFVNNFLIILKTLINSYIYAARMHEIKSAMTRMKYSIASKCCKCLLGKSDNDGINSEYSRNHYFTRASTQRRSKKTFVCRLQSIPRHDRGASLDRDAYSTPL